MMEVELSNFILRRALNSVSSILRAEELSLGLLVGWLLVNLDSCIRSNPVSWSIIKITIRRFDYVSVNINLLERVFQINR